MFILFSVSGSLRKYYMPSKMLLKYVMAISNCVM